MTSRGRLCARSQARRLSSGAAALEFAIIGLVFITLVMLCMETGYQMAIDAALDAGARAASRFGTTGATVAPNLAPAPTNRGESIQQIVLQYSGGLLQISRLQITEQAYADFPSLAAGRAGTPGPGTGGEVVQYTFTYTQPYITPFAAAIAGQSQVIHSVRLTVVNEPFPSS
jgi:Flp pilus assembly protein TadG